MADTGLTYDEWRTRVPDLVTDCCKEWDLRLGAPYTQRAAGYTTRAELEDGTPVVLKIIFPHRESEHEADALELLNGDGAVRLLRRDDDLKALLLERCEPGTYLSSLPADRAIDVFVELLPRLWKPADKPFRTLEEEAEWWLEGLSETPGVEQQLIDAARDALRGLAPTQGAQVLLHQDLHAGNVLAAQREPWLVIDPKPLVGEHEFSVAPIVRSFELGHSKRDVFHRLDRLTRELDLDRDRAIGWTIAQTVAWSGSDYIETDVEMLRWLLE